MKARQACTNFTGAEGAGAGRCPQVGLQCVHGGHFKQGAMRRGGRSERGALGITTGGDINDNGVSPPVVIAALAE